MPTSFAALFFIVASAASSAPLLEPLTTPLTTPLRPSTADAFVWQRDSSAADVDDTVAAFARFSSGRLHVVIADDDATDLNTRFVARRDRSVPLVVTLRFTALPPIEHVGALLAPWKTAAIAAVEIDHDCATRALPAYAAWLRRLNDVVDVPLAITGLPTWFGGSAVDDLFAAIDDTITVQLHAIRAPKLFVVDDALRFIRSDAAMSPRVHVALPTYAVTLRGGAAIAADPAEVAVVVDEAHAADVHIAWFRLPATVHGTADVAAWRWSTLLRVDAADVVAAAPPRIELVDHADGSSDVVVVNDDVVDRPLSPAFIDGVVVGDARAGFALTKGNDGVRFTSTTARFIGAGERVVVGWIRRR